MDHKAVRQELYGVIVDIDEKHVDVLDNLVKYTFVAEDTIESLTLEIQKLVQIIEEERKANQPVELEEDKDEVEVQE